MYGNLSPLWLSSLCLSTTLTVLHMLASSQQGPRREMPGLAAFVSFRIRCHLFVPAASEQAVISHWGLSDPVLDIFSFHSRWFPSMATVARATLTVTECSPQARVQCSTCYLHLLALSENHTALKPGQHCASGNKHYKQSLHSEGCNLVGDDISAMPRALYIISVCLPGWGAALFWGLFLSYGGSFAGMKWKNVYISSGCKTLNTQLPYHGVGTTLRHKLPSRAPAAGLGWKTPAQDVPGNVFYMASLPFLSFPHVFTGAPWGNFLHKLLCENPLSQGPLLKNPT